MLDNDNRVPCTDCSVHSPSQSAENTLISTLGWRLTRRQTNSGIILEWRCPTCWAQYKLNRGDPSSSRREVKG